MSGTAGAVAPGSIGGLDIDHGGAIAVDTEQLRVVGARMLAVAYQYDDAREAIGRALALITSAPRSFPLVDVGALRWSGERVGALRDEIGEACAGVLLMVDAFELVELRARAEALALTDAAAADAVQVRIDRLTAGDERIDALADRLVADGKARRFEGLGGQYDLGGALPHLFLAGAFVGVVSGLGKVAPGAPLKGAADPVRVDPVRTSTPAAAPKDLAAALGRMPKASAQVAVEKYTMADGTTRYVAYVKGTQNSAPWQAGAAEPWDMKSNVELYRGQRSASYQATLDALALAGAGPGDQVDVVAHSQGGMIAARLAMESEFDVSLQLTAGSPEEPTLRDDQTIVQLRHTDDVVSALAAGGSAEGTGSPDSFTATRVGDPDDGFQDFTLKTHGLETYIETAEMVDESHDPRAEALDVYWSDLGEAVAVERTEFHAQRTE
jgi:hypothetical protein